MLLQTSIWLIIHWKIAEGKGIVDINYELISVYEKIAIFMTLSQ